MKLKYTSTLFLVLMIFVLTFQACKNDDNPQPTESAVLFKFEHYIDGNPLTFNQILYTNAFGNKYSVETLKYFISNIRLTRDDGTEILVDGEYYVDATDESTTQPLDGVDIPVGDYTSISFVFGLNEDNNIAGRFPNPPENNMEWPPALGTGYHYMKLEGKIDSTGTINNYQAHTGPTNGTQNFIEVTLPESSFTAGGSAMMLKIRMNINNWWENPNTLDLNTVTGIMGNQQMQLKLKANGENVFSFAGVEYPLQATD